MSRLSAAVCPHFGFVCSMVDQLGARHAHGSMRMQVTEGPHAGRLALIDFGLVAEVPAPDRAAMLSATIHLANGAWDDLITDFIALGAPLLPPVTTCTLQVHLAHVKRKTVFLCRENIALGISAYPCILAPVRSEGKSCFVCQKTVAEVPTCTSVPLQVINSP